MKKLLLFAGLFGLFITTTQAQEIRLGAKAGVNLSNLIIKDADPKPDMLTSFHLGGVVEIPITETFSVQPEILYSAQGAKYSESETEVDMGVTYSYSSEMKMKLGYINIPILAKYYVAEGFSLQAGPQFGFLMSAKADVDMTETISGMGMNNTESYSGSVDIKDELNAFDLSLGVGAAYRLDMGVFFEARYNFGLTNISKENDENSKNSVIQVSVGYSF